MDKLDVNPSQAPRAELRTKENALNWIEELLAEMTYWRNQCRVAYPSNPELTVRQQRRALWTFLTKQGQLTGALKTLRLMGLLDERAYLEYNQKAINSLIPDLIGST